MVGWLLCITFLYSFLAVIAGICEWHLITYQLLRSLHLYKTDQERVYLKVMQKCECWSNSNIFPPFKNRSRWFGGYEFAIWSCTLFLKHLIHKSLFSEYCQSLKISMHLIKTRFNCSYSLLYRSIIIEYIYEAFHFINNIIRIDWKQKRSQSVSWIIPDS